MEQEHGLKKENSYMLNSGDSAAFARLRWTSSQVNVSTQDLWTLVTFGLEEIISSMAVVTFSGQRIPAFDKKLNYTLPDEEVRSQNRNKEATLGGAMLHPKNEQIAPAKADQECGNQMVFRIRFRDF